MLEKVKVLLGAILAGFSIGLGGFIFLSVDNKIIGSLLFSIGLFLVLTLNLNLFTGKICYLGAKSSLLDFLLIWVGNFIGTYSLAQIILHTRT